MRYLVRWIWVVGRARQRHPLPCPQPPPRQAPRLLRALIAVLSSSSMLWFSCQLLDPGATPAQAPSKAWRAGGIPWMKLVAGLKGIELPRATEVFCCKGLRDLENPEHGEPWVGEPWVGEPPVWALSQEKESKPTHSGGKWQETPWRAICPRPGDAEEPWPCSISTKRGLSASPGARRDLPGPAALLSQALGSSPDL